MASGSVTTALTARVPPLRTRVFTSTPKVLFKRIAHSTLARGA